jgi:pimeloyl-ACP methyl ester carboxylesterase
VFMTPRHVMIDENIPVGEEVVLTSQGTPLAASLLKPTAPAGRVPGVVMIVGSGSYSYRSSWRPGAFALWRNFSEAFLAKGYAVLLLEKKGVNRSGGHWETQTFHDRAGDAIAGVRYLRGRTDIDPARVGVCGHSQGGWIAQLAAAEDPEEIAFVANLAGPNISVKRQVLDDQENEWRCAGVGEDRIASNSRWLRRKLDAYGAVSRAVKIGTLSHIINYDPGAENVPGRITCPVLAIYGEYDRLVLPEGNIPLLEKGLRAGGNTRARIVIVPKGSHGFIRKTIRCPEEVNGVPAMAPEFFEAVAAWDPFAT